MKPIILNLFSSDKISKKTKTLIATIIHLQFQMEESINKHFSLNNKMT